MWNPRSIRRRRAAVTIQRAYRAYRLRRPNRIVPTRRQYIARQVRAHHARHPIYRSSHRC